ncbi:hypothetical protein UNDKW_3882 [Undibacterium sp. KW1]|uniref:hypothetical protein n=1 Tax=Undibacterium sp. KW1 TaxID=2058624 RepID=UPI001331E3AD|nr:hypothetical protein [Undibacterium sp. KW1]BBB62155.1 hypothetical protein UNDKW_3882 [Undibacterium sp. KW1]
MIEDVVSLLINAGKISDNFKEIRFCTDFLSANFASDYSLLQFKKSFVADDLESLVNLIIEPKNTCFEKLLHFELEIQERWHSLNGIHHFQLGQLMLYREVAVFRFVHTMLSSKAITGAIYFFGKNYEELVASDDNSQRQLPSWINSVPWKRYTGVRSGISANIPSYMLSEEEVASWPEVD